MRTKLYTLVFLLLVSLGLSAQEGKQDKIDALRVAFITDELKLTSDEAQKFWPVYNEYQDKLKAVRKDFLKATPASFNSDKEAQEYLDAELLYKQREVGLYKDYCERFKKVLPIKKVAQLRQAEEKFKKKLVELLREKNN